jgi:probable lipoprotein NlpC
LERLPSGQEASPEQARHQVLAAAGKYQGVPYRYGGMDRRGLDCSALIYLSFRDALDVKIPRTVAALYGWVEKIPDRELLPGDLVFFTTAGPLGGVSHGGIYAGEGRFIHAASGGPHRGVIYSQLSDAYWQRNYAGAGRVLAAGNGLPGPARSLAGETGAPGGREDGPGGFLFGLAAAVNWNLIPDLGGSFRGVLLEAGGAYAFGLSPESFRLGLELRPHWDSALGIIRLPLTLSLGFGGLVRVFAGPALTLGNPVSAGGRRYTGDAAWLGTAGIMAAPFTWDLGGRNLALYGEIAWESLYRDPSQEASWDADFGAALRVSTGLRWGF